MYMLCGFVMDDYNLWLFFIWMFFIFVMLLGGCMGFISGGIKNMCFMILVCNIKNEFKWMLYFRVVLFVCVNC